MIPSYGKIYRVGSRDVQDIFKGPVVVQEKVDGFQFSFGLDEEGQVQARSRDRALPLDDASFALALESAQKAAKDLAPGVNYRGEFLRSPRHNVLKYGRAPKGHIALFEFQFVNTGEVRTEGLSMLAGIFGMEAVPTLFEGRVESLDQLESLMRTESFLGGPMEGVVIKSLTLKDRDGYPMRAKYVSESFKEVAQQPRTKQLQGIDPLDTVAQFFTSEARFHKAVQRLRDDGRLKGEMSDIGPLIGEVQRDLREEEEEEIKDRLLKAFWKQIGRRATAGLAEWYAKCLAEDTGE